MHSSLIGKIEKARRYAQEPDRIKLQEFTAEFRGEHSSYTVTYRNQKWHCTCHFFSQWNLCSHTMALQQLLDKMLPEEALSSPTTTASADQRLKPTA
jgi:hypothetical protein